ncbi:preprotein translocase, SecG subunit [Parvibaculum lavamentivorans DS-1]|uniref:Protein-export membrane protein SecG n=1 Tax=Parvibaculum lavamentivorans (strain DS-1 / DSM 13023 / NCIMB 13966) TaxID=402881 RepID=A7HXY0_PARL1|nr:preprotein translocase subunit SecG [Parvibaculum lavamentivorans]ABS64763.1 preprotein translocase, SecG subunit [Parvibaculum lavamentivorans DS-1]
MATIILIIHLILALALVATVLLQRSEGGALGIGGGGDGFMSGRGAGNALTRATAVLAALFITTSLVLGILASRGGSADGILDRIAPPTAGGDETVPDVPAPLGSEFPDLEQTPAANQPETATDEAPAAPVQAPEPAEPGVPRAQ